jgi:hypothetical protein
MQSKSPKNSKRKRAAGSRSLDQLARSLRGYWQDKSPPPERTGFYLIHAPSADPKSPLLAMCWWNGETWEGLVAVWLKAITHWMPLPKPPTKRPNGRTEAPRE